MLRADPRRVERRGSTTTVITPSAGRRRRPRLRRRFGRRPDLDPLASLVRFDRVRRAIESYLAACTARRLPSVPRTSATPILPGTQKRPDQEGWARSDGGQQTPLTDRRMPQAVFLTERAWRPDHVDTKLDDEARDRCAFEVFRSPQQDPDAHPGRQARRGLARHCPPRAQASRSN